MSEELYKEAFLNPHFMQGFKNTFLATKPLAREADDLVHVTKNSRHVRPGFEHRYSPEEIAAEIKRKDIADGNGFVLGGLLGATKFVGDRIARGVTKNPEVKWSGSDAIDNASAAVKQKSRDWSTKGGEKILDLIGGGDKPGSLRGRIFSTQVDTKVGERVLADKSVIPIIERQRRASIGAPIENTLKIGTPFLASAYLAEKLLPQDKQAPTSTVKEIAEAIPEPHLLERRASEAVYALEKQAMLDKTALLENQLMDKQATIDFLQRERETFEKMASDSVQRADSFEKRAATLEQDLFEKQAAHEEFVIRMAARERSGPAVKIATELLDKGFIKQAQYQDKIDELMDCSEDLLNIYEKMAGSGIYGEESLESLAYMQDTYISSNGQSSSRVAKGHSKTGQTIGEAAHELLSNRNGG